MEKADNEMYALVDEEFLAKFSNQHLNYMKKLYYSFYAGYCKRIKRKPLTSEDFFKNMHLRRFQLYQLCCPYCGTVSLCIHDKKESKTAGYNFCHSCGRTSTLKNIQKHLARFVRIKRMNRISIQAVAEHRPETEKWLLAYDCYHTATISRQTRTKPPMIPARIKFSANKAIPLPREPPPGMIQRRSRQMPNGSPQSIHNHR